MHNDGPVETLLARCAELEICFTPDEICHLIELRRRYASLVQYREQGLDMRRLEFARRLVRSGRLSEGMASEGMAMAASRAA